MSSDHGDGDWDAAGAVVDAGSAKTTAGAAASSSSAAARCLDWDMVLVCLRKVDTSIPIAAKFPPPFRASGLRAAPGATPPAPTLKSDSLSNRISIRTFFIPKSMNCAIVRVIPIAQLESQLNCGSRSHQRSIPYSRPAAGCGVGSGLCSATCSRVAVGTMSWAALFDCSMPTCFSIRAGSWV